MSWAASKNISDAPELPFFFLDKDSICHRAIYSLRVRISMISNHSASLVSPWHHLCNTSQTDDTYIPLCELHIHALFSWWAFKTVSEEPFYIPTKLKMQFKTKTLCTSCVLLMCPTSHLTSNIWTQIVRCQLHILGLVCTRSMHVPIPQTLVALDTDRTDDWVTCTWIGGDGRTGDSALVVLCSWWSRKRHKNMNCMLSQLVFYTPLTLTQMN